MVRSNANANALLWKEGPVRKVWKLSFCKESELSRDKVARTDIVAAIGNDSMSTPAMREKSPIFLIGLLE
jgi:hypothetical protein